MLLLLLVVVLVLQRAVLQTMTDDAQLNAVKRDARNMPRTAASSNVEATITTLQVRWSAWPVDDRA